MAGGALLSGPGQACLDALRAAAFLVQQHRQDLKEALGGTTASSTTEGGEGGCLAWLEAHVCVLQGVLKEAGLRGAPSRRRRRKKRRRQEERVEEGQAGEGGEADEEAEVR